MVNRFHEHLNKLDPRINGILTDINAFTALAKITLKLTLHKHTIDRGKMQNANWAKKTNQ